MGFYGYGSKSWHQNSFSSWLWMFIPLTRWWHNQHLQAAPCSKRHSSKQIWQVKRSFASCQEHNESCRKKGGNGFTMVHHPEDLEKIHQDTSRCHIPSMFHKFNGVTGHRLIRSAGHIWAPSLPLRCRRIPAAWCCQIYCRIGLVCWNVSKYPLSGFTSPVPMAC